MSFSGMFNEGSNDNGTVSSPNLNGDAKLKIKVGSSRKAANLSELNRYFKAAQEAAQEVLTEQGDEDIDVKKLAKAGAKPINSPSRLVALQLANSNPNFREKLKAKLEETGGMSFQMEQFNSNDFNGKRNERKPGNVIGSPLISQEEKLLKKELKRKQREETATPNKYKKGIYLSIYLSVCLSIYVLFDFLSCYF
jgi:hypothetical protein